jgi:hypothetical protein
LDFWIGASAMAPLDMTIGSGEAAPSFGDASPAELSFAFGGVHFEIAPDTGLRWSLPAPSREFALSSTVATCAAVTCAVGAAAALPELPAAATASSVWESTADGLRVRSRNLTLDVTLDMDSPSDHFASTAQLADPSAAAELLVLLASAVLELSGGLCLHATAVELPEGALLLLGPSGAGKTTAAQLLGAFPCLANDRVAVAPSGRGGGYEVWALPGGSPPRLARSRARVLPLAGFVRIAQAYEKPRVRRLRPGEAALCLREAVEIGVGAGFLEPRRLETVSRLALAAAGGKAEVVLGHSWAPELRSFLTAAAPAEAQP